MLEGYPVLLVWWAGLSIYREMSNDELDLRDRFVFDIGRPLKDKENENMINKCKCMDCVYLDTHTCLPDGGGHRCKLSRSFNPLVTDNCRFSRDFMPIDATIKVLHDAQKWRRGGKAVMLPPYLFGLAIDRALTEMRWFRKWIVYGGCQHG